MDIPSILESCLNEGSKDNVSVLAPDLPLCSHLSVVTAFTSAASSWVGPQGLMGLLPTPQRVEKEYKMPLLACAETEHEGDHG